MGTTIQNITNKFKTGNKLYLILAVNVVIFLIALLFPAAGAYLSLPAYLPALQHYFWTPLTYMFLNEGLFSVIFTLLWLYWMGQIFEEYLGYKRILGVYLLGGLTGAVLFVASSNLIPHTGAITLSNVAGAPISVMTVMVATATLLPNLTIMLFIWPVRLKWLVAIYAIIDLVNIKGMGTDIIIAHAGGALFGFLYIKQLQKGTDWVGWISGLFKSGSKLKVVAKNPLRRETYRPRQEDVDRILDKISQNGYESLSKEEKEILFRASKNES